MGSQVQKTETRSIEDEHVIYIDQNGPGQALIICNDWDWIYSHLNKLEW